MRTMLLDGEKVILQDGVHRQCGGERGGMLTAPVQGNLYLTSMRLIFEPHAHDKEMTALVLKNEDIRSVSTAWVKYFVVPFLPAAFTVSDGTYSYTFYAIPRGPWIGALKAILARAP